MRPRSPVPLSHLIQSFSVIFVFTFKLTKISVVLIKHLVSPLTFYGSIFSFLLLPDTCCLYCWSAHFLYNSLKTSFSLCFSSGLLFSWKWFLLANSGFCWIVMPLWCSITPGSQFPLVPKTILSCMCACRSSYIDVLVDSWTDVFSLSYYVACHETGWESEFCSAFSLPLF